jgi:hypothetical protein
MRLWSIHPKYLDAKGLVALWREALLAQSVLQNKTKGYRNHPQLNRFKRAPDPVSYVGAYLREVYSEACRRGYRFSGQKICGQDEVKKLPVTQGQLEYEWRHFLGKMKIRSPEIHKSALKISMPDHHPLFRVKSGEKEEWEK